MLCGDVPSPQYIFSRAVASLVGLKILEDLCSRNKTCGLRRVFRYSSLISNTGTSVLMDFNFFSSLEVPGVNYHQNRDPYNL